MALKTNQAIPKATAKRLPAYYRHLNLLADAGKKSVNSSQLAEALKIDAATVRRDFSYFGALGKRGVGYAIAPLLALFKKTLNQEELTNVILVGVGNLGAALLNYNFQKCGNICIEAAFDVAASKINTSFGDVCLQPMTNLKQYVKKHHINVAILTVPADAAQAVADVLVDADIVGIMNFTPRRLSVPKHVRVQNVDLANELQTLIYYLHHEQN